jgi:glycosyltransferase involved in cell wall biosynthesis
MADRVSLLGERPPEELVDWYRAADVMLLTSSREGRPNVVLEALSTGCPVVATNAGGTAEIITSERMLSRTRDAGEIGAMLASLLSDPPTPEALRASIEPLTWRSSLDALERTLSEVASKA